jgi:hypothetical protein
MSLQVKRKNLPAKWQIASTGERRLAMTIETESSIPESEAALHPERTTE